MKLRYYQAAAVQAALSCLQAGGVNPCLEIPTGGGKTPIIATIARVLAESGARVLILAHRKELLEQTAEKMQVWAENVPFSIVSAGLGEKDYSGRVVIAGIQSVYKNAAALNACGKINFVLVDEAHLIPNTDITEAAGMYQTLLSELRAENPRLLVCGLTATPFRLKSGTVVGEDKILNKIVYKIGVPELIEKGFLSKIISRLPESEINLDSIRIENGEFKTADIEREYGAENIISGAVGNIIAATKNRNSVLVFCGSVAHAEKVAEALQRGQSAEVAIVTGATPSIARADCLERFKEGKIKFLVNVDVLTTGFDATNVDTVVLLRPTLSPGLYYQMVGRGFRIHPGKEDCLVLDFGGNILRHGPVDELNVERGGREKAAATVKKCKTCRSIIPAAAKTCPECGAILINDDFACPSCGGMNDNRASFCMYCGFQLRAPKHSAQAEFFGSVVSTEAAPTITEEIAEINYSRHTSKTSGKESLRVTYVTAKTGTRLSEYVCFNHEGFAKQKALKWWAERSNITPAPCSVVQAYYLAEGGYIARPTAIKYKPKKPGEYSPEIVGFDVERKIIGNNPYPRTDNPLAIACQICGASSFTYVQTGEMNFEIRCAKCGELFGEFNPGNCEGVEGLKGELDNHRRAGIEYFNPDKKYNLQSGEVEEQLAELFGGKYSTSGPSVAGFNDYGLPDDIPF